MRASGVLLQSVLTEAGVRHIAEWGLEHFVPSEHIAEWVLNNSDSNERLIICKGCTIYMYTINNEARGCYIVSQT